METVAFSAHPSVMPLGFGRPASHVLDRESAKGTACRYFAAANTATDHPDVQRVAERQLPRAARQERRDGPNRNIVPLFKLLRGTRLFRCKRQA
jgi:hypothetical protein